MTAVSDATREGAIFNVLRCAEYYFKADSHETLTDATPKFRPGSEFLQLLRGKINEKTMKIKQFQEKYRNPGSKFLIVTFLI